MENQTEAANTTKGIGSTLDENREVIVYRLDDGDYVLKFINKNNVGNETQMIRLTDEAARTVSDSIRCLALNISADEWNERAGL